MAHAEKCPVCNGAGKYNEKICHGCNGKGWIEVGNNSFGTPVPYPYNPCPYRPNEPFITWTWS